MVQQLEGVQSCMLTGTHLPVPSQACPIASTHWLTQSGPPQNVPDFDGAHVPSGWPVSVMLHA